MRLFTKTLVLIVILFAAIAVTISLLSARILSSSLTAEYESKGRAIAEGIADSSTEILLNRNLATVQAVIDLQGEIDGVSYIFVTDGAGNMLAHNFIPEIPEQVLPLARISSEGKIVEGISMTRVEIPGRGTILHVHAPVLAGLVGAVHVGMDLEYIENHIWDIIVREQILMFAIFLAVVGIAYVFVNRIVQPISRLAAFVRGLASHEFASDLDISREIRSLSRKHSGEIRELADSFIAMENTLQQYLRDLEETTSAKQRIESELSIAHEIQMSMIPKIFPPFPDRKEFDLHAKLISAREVGGDFYDFYFIDQRHLCFAIGDVSGKGVPASLFMALTKTLFRATGGETSSTASGIFDHLNREISRDNDSCMFVTAFCGVLDTETGAVEYCNAGHNQPMVIQEGKLSVLPKSGDVALGVVETAGYSSHRLQLAPGDQLILYTDGITEAMDGQEQFFSESRLESTLEELKSHSARIVVRDVLQTVRDFTGDTPQSDDMTILVIRYRGPGASAVPTLAVRLKNRKTELQRFNDLMREFGSEHDIPEETIFRVNLSMDEILTNVLRYGYQDEEEHEISVVATWDREWMTIEVHDDGTPFNPLEVASPDTSEALEEREIGGLGIHIVRTMMDDLSYRRELDTNVLTLKTEPREG